MKLPHSKSPSTGFLNSLQNVVGASQTASSRPASARISVPGYVIQEELGRGGMGVVYKAIQVKLNRPVALKMILAGEHSAAEGLQRFHSEAEAVARLQHPNIVQIYEVGDCDGRPYFSLEYIDGGSLADFSRGHPMSPDLAAYLIEQLACGVQCAHDQQIVHRDLKPANILLGQMGPSAADTAISQIDTVTMKNAFANLQESPVISQSGNRLVPKITDFGLAKQLDRHSNVSNSGELVGTPQYMAPELMQSTTRDSAGYSADIYSLGAILYELLTGRPPFLGHNRPQIFLQALTLEPVPPRQLVASLPLDLQTICLKCLEKDPSNRYRNAEALANDLRRYLEGRPIAARPISSVEQVMRWVKRYPSIASVVGFMVVGSILTTLTAAYAWREASRADRNATAARVLESEAILARKAAEAARVEETRLREDAQNHAQQRLRELYASQMGAAYRAWENGEFALSRKLLDGHVPPSGGSSDLRGFEWHYLDRLCRLDIRHFQTKNAACTSLILSPDGRCLILTTPSAFLVHDAKTGEFKHRIDLDDSAPMLPAFASGQLIALNRSSGAIQSWKTTDSASLAAPTRYLTAADLAGLSGLRLTPDGQTLVGYQNIVNGTRVIGRILVQDASNGSTNVRKAYPDGQVMDLAISPDGKRIATASESGSVHLLSIDGSKTESVAVASSALSCVAWSPQGKLLAAGTVDGELVLIDPSTTTVRHRSRLHSRPISHLAFAADGARIASAASDRIVRVVDVIRGKEITSFRGHSDVITGLSFLKDEPDLLVSSARDGVVKTWDVRVPSDSAWLATPQPSVAGLVSDKVLALANERTLSVYPLNAPPEPTLLPRLANIPQHASVSPTGEFFAYSHASAPEKILFASLNPGIAVPGPLTAPEAIRGFTWTPDGRSIATWHRTDWIRVYRIEGGSPTQIHTRSPIRQLAFRRGGDQCLGFADDGSIRVWDTATGEERWNVLRTTRDVLALGFAPDGQTFAVAIDDRVELFDLAGKKMLWVACGHTETVRSLAFNPDGSRLATAGNDGVVKIWDVTSGMELLALRGHRDPVKWMAFTADGSRLLSLSDSELRLWSAQK